MNDPILIGCPDPAKDLIMQQMVEEKHINDIFVNHLNSRGATIPVPKESCLYTGNKVMPNYNFLMPMAREDCSWMKAYDDIGKPSKAKRLKARAQRKKMKKHHKKNR